jgi:hypothetical protein
VWSFCIDFIPAVRTKHYASKETSIEMAEEEAIGGMNGDTNAPASRNF